MSITVTFHWCSHWNACTLFFFLELQNIHSCVVSSFLCRHVQICSCIHWDTSHGLSYRHMCLVCVLIVCFYRHMCLVCVLINRYMYIASCHLNLLCKRLLCCVCLQQLTSEETNKQANKQYIHALHLKALYGICMCVQVSKQPNCVQTNKQTGKAN